MSLRKEAPSTAYPPSPGWIRSSHRRFCEKNVRRFWSFDCELQSDGRFLLMLVFR
ncbi:hypothetical protein RBSWK_01258 [Rhodopirellula baltica SWK14]|uniref:Uncharacterized protein n=1 Tax=Rhodopirellula baltica SWK14 TaxID=993516 RepID=L7CNV5_RHOBT|nr:hypothetical protein RBSWK_01258 [Rhodopirellula baltica SWK14]